MKKEEVYGHIDHTLLKAFSTTEQIEAIAEEALKYGTASICIPTNFVPCNDGSRGRQGQDNMGMCTL